MSHPARRGTCIYWDEARGCLYFTFQSTTPTFDENTGRFENEHGTDVTPQVEVAAVLDQMLINEFTTSPVHGRTGSFVEFKGFNEEVDYKLVSLDNS